MTQNVGLPVSTALGLLPERVREPAKPGTIVLVPATLTVRASTALTT